MEKVSVPEKQMAQVSTDAQEKAKQKQAEGSKNSKNEMKELNEL